MAPVYNFRWIKTSQTIFDAISTCKQLTHLDLSSTILDGNLISTLEMVAPQLVDLNLSDSYFLMKENLNSINQLFAEMKFLKSLGLNKYSGDLSSSADLPAKLQCLNAKNVKSIDPDDFRAFLLSHPNLRELRLSGTHRLDDLSLQLLGSLTDLEVLEITNIHQDDLDFSSLGGLSNLKELNLEQNQSIRAESLRIICCNLSRLQILNLSSCKRILDFSSLEHCNSLKSYTVSSTCHFCDEDLISLGKNGKISSLNITRCHNISATGVLDLANNCPLREVSLHFCPSIGNKTLIGIASNPNGPAHISIQNSGLNSDGLIGLASLGFIDHIKELDVSYNRMINDSGVLAVHSALQAERSQNSNVSVDEKRQLILYAHRTGVSLNLAPLVSDCINVIL